MDRKETWERLLQIGVVEGPMVKGKWELPEAHLNWAFLHEADFVGACLSGAYLRGADLSGADLKGADLAGARLTGANLKGANLLGADLSGASPGGADFRDVNLCGARLPGLNLTTINLTGANLSWSDLAAANLRGLDLSQADLTGANLAGANLRGANLRGACLRFADLTGTSLGEADLSGANLSGLDFAACELAEAKLRGADLREANLKETDLRGVDLRGADLRGCNLSLLNFTGANLAYADLSDANLCGSDFSGCNFTGSRLARSDLSEAKLFNCVVHGLLAQDVRLENTVQSHLIISPKGQPPIIADSLKAALVVGLLLYGPGVREVLDGAGSRIVLILGRFAGERKVMADMLRRKLTDRNYTGILVEVDGREGGERAEVVRLLASMAKIVIADVSESGGLPGELVAALPSLSSVPVQIVFQGQSREGYTFEQSRRFPWVLPVYNYTDATQAVDYLLDKVILPADASLSKGAKQDALFAETENQTPAKEEIPAG